MTAHLSFSGFEEQKPESPWLFKNLQGPKDVDQVSFCLTCSSYLSDPECGFCFPTAKLKRNEHCHCSIIPFSHPFLYMHFDRAFPQNGDHLPSL